MYKYNNIQRIVKAIFVPEQYVFEWLKRSSGPPLNVFKPNGSLCWSLWPISPSAVGWSISDSCAVIGCSRRRLPWHSGCCTASAPQHRQASDHPAYYPLPFFSSFAYHPLTATINLSSLSLFSSPLLFLLTITERPEKQQEQNQVGWYVCWGLTGSWRDIAFSSDFLQGLCT